MAPHKSTLVLPNKEDLHSNTLYTHTFILLDLGGRLCLKDNKLGWAGNFSSHVSHDNEKVNSDLHNLS